jgi:hypothetical protein
MKTKPDSGIEQLKAFIRQPYAWPGGYPLYAVMGDRTPDGVRYTTTNVWLALAGLKD